MDTHPAPARANSPSKEKRKISVVNTIGTKSNHYSF